MSGNLVTARNILDSVREGRIDVGPLDAYWHLLIARHAPHLTAGIRVLASTPLTPLPAFVASAGASQENVARLRAAFLDSASRPWFPRFGRVAAARWLCGGGRGAILRIARVGPGRKGGWL